MKLLRLCAAMTVLVVLTGCGDGKPAPDSASAGNDGPGVVDGAFLPHEGEASSAAAVSAMAPASADGISAPAPAVPDFVTEMRTAEAAQLKLHPDVAHRDGGVLTIQANGKPIARFTDVAKSTCEGFDDCSAWGFAGIASLQTSPGHPESYAVVRQSGWENDTPALIAPNGTLYWLDSDFTSSPDGRFLAVGEQQSLEGDGLFEIVDFASPLHRLHAVFNAQCAPGTWRSATELNVECSHDDSQTVLTSAVVKQNPGGLWQLKEVARIDPKTRKPLKTSKLKLQTQTVKLSPQRSSPIRQQAAEQTFNKKVGYERLALPDGP